MGDAGEPLGDGEIGNLWVRGESAFSEYWRIPELTARTKRVVVGTARVKIVTGKTKKFTVRLNKLGKSLLKKFGKLPVNAAIRLIGTNGKVVATINTKFTIRKHRARR